MKTSPAPASSEAFIFSRALDEICPYCCFPPLPVPIPEVMREYFPWEWKQIRALLSETSFNRHSQLFSHSLVTICSIRVVNVNRK